MERILVCSECGCCDGTCACYSTINTKRILEEQERRATRGVGRLPVVTSPEFLPDSRYLDEQKWPTSSIPVSAFEVSSNSGRVFERMSPMTDRALDILLGLVVVPCFGVLTVFSTIYIMITALDSLFMEFLELLRFPIL